MQLLIFMCKAKECLLPDCCSNLVTIADENRCYQLRSKSDFVQVRFNSSIRQKSIAVAGPDL